MFTTISSDVTRGGMPMHDRKLLWVTQMLQKKWIDTHTPTKKT